jgi:hypothetical protein
MRTRASIAALMTVVGIVALNLSVLRALYATRRVDFLLGGAVMSVLWQVAVFRAFRTSGRSRLFWAGFAGGGTLAALSLIAAYYFPHSLMGILWWGYGDLVGGWLEGLVLRLAPGFGFNGVVMELTFVLLVTASEFIPIILAALLGGLLTWPIGKRRGLPDPVIS